MLAGLVKAPTAYDPAASDQTRGAGPAQLRHRPDGRHRVPLPGAGRPGQGDADRAAPDQPAQRLHLGHARAQRLGLLLRHAEELVAQAAGVRRQPAGSGRRTCAAAATPIVTSLDPKHPGGRDGRGDRRRASAARTPSAWSRCNPGTGQIQAAAVNRSYSLDQSRNGPHTDPRQAQGGRQQLPEHGRRRCSDGATCRATRPARRSRSSRCSPPWSRACR